MIRIFGCLSAAFMTGEVVRYPEMVNALGAAAYRRLLSKAR